jgi:hypothetical protein
MSQKNMLFLVLRIIMFVLFVTNLIGIFLSGDDSQKGRLAFNAIQSILFMATTFVPGFIEKKGKVEIPDFMEVIYIFFCICHFILGEVVDFYEKFNWWDSMLHTLTGSMIAILGFSIVNSINYSKKHSMNIDPVLVALFAICFAITIGVLWEIVEYGVDGTFGTNMQRYADLYTSVDFVGRRALMDTMKDLMLDTIGASVIAVIGFISIRHQKDAFREWTITKIDEISQQTK